MKDIALQLALQNQNQKLNVLREYLQNYVLFLMQKTGMSRFLYFVGGTALRFLYRIRRYSEDLDFSAGPDWSQQKIKNFSKQLEQHLIDAGYSCMIKSRDTETVQRLIIGFEELLHEIGLSHRKEQKLNVHLEIDLNPPAGWIGEKTIVDLYQPVLLQHYALPSLMSGKMHALLMRPYTKGRDFFDLYWYRTNHPGLKPNFKMLNNAIQQTHPGSIEVNEANWRTLLKEKLKSLDWKTVENDVMPFIEFQDDLMVFNRDNLLNLL